MIAPKIKVQGFEIAFYIIHSGKQNDQSKTANHFWQLTFSP
jgi:hypothetical protein